MLQHLLSEFFVEPGGRCCVRGVCGFVCASLGGVSDVDGGICVWGGVGGIGSGGGGVDGCLSVLLRRQPGLLGLGGGWFLTLVCSFFGSGLTFHLSGGGLSRGSISSSTIRLATFSLQTGQLSLGSSKGS